MMSEVSELKIGGTSPWFHCDHCYEQGFHKQSEFLRHIKEKHCSKEGGSYVCLYGPNNVCSSLPLEGVDDHDYEEHVVRQHIYQMSSKSSAIGKNKMGGPEKWGVFSSTQNIPSVLNDPKKGIKRDLFTKTWGESFVDIGEIPPHVALPNISPRQFDSYIRKLRKRHKLKLKISAKEAAKHDETRLGPPAGLVNLHESLPSIFLSSSFNLQDPTTFYSVFSHITASGVSKKNSKPLQEKLFTFLEIVESDMCKQIARKSSAFFDTMTYLNVQMEQLELNHKAVCSLRDGISHLRKETVVEPVKVLSLPRKRNNMEKCLQKLDLMNAVREVQSTIQELLARQEYSSALVLISTTQDLLTTELSGIKCLRHLGSELAEHEKLIDKIVTTEFSKYITEDLNRPSDDTKPLLEEDQLIRVVFGVLRLQKVDFLQNLQEEIQAAINAIIKQTVAEAVMDTEMDHETTNVMDQSKSLSISSWLDLVDTITSRLQILMKRVQVIVGVIMQAVEACAGNIQSTKEGVHAESIVTMESSGVNEPMLSASALIKATTTLKETLFTACDYAHERCAKLLHVRSRDQALDRMTAKEFIRLSKIIEDFVSFTETVCGRKSTSFRMGLQGQASRFVSRFHEERETRLKSNLTTERWKAVSIPTDVQDLFNYIFNTGNLAFPSPPDDYSNGIEPVDSSLQLDQSTTSEPEDKILYVDGQEFMVVGVCFVVVRLIVEYSECACTLKLAAQQLLMRLTDLLRRFNADTCRLLVEAGAVNLRVRTITTRHLALAWRSLQLLLLLMPKITDHFSELLKREVVQKNIDQVSQNYIAHCEAIRNKIVFIVGASLDVELKHWEARSPIPSPSFTNILSSISKLYDVIASILTKKQVEDVFGGITNSLKEKLRNQVSRLQISPKGPQSWIVTSELTFYFNKLSHLGVQSVLSQEKFMEELWSVS